jgi:tetratricopeptide (TPR) repeat protein
MAKVPLRVYNREIETIIDRGQLDEAIAHCLHIFKTFPKHLETYRLLGKAYLEYKRYKDAADIFSRVLVSEPNDFVANVGMSIIRDEENKLDDAIWHMERAFETQPSNAAIQSELQRLYGRRDGVQPPRIRMTRGALAHMYVQGELYPQAISEIKSVLKEDPGRSDMEALLARACYRSGLKNEAADAASKVLRRYPYCLDPNRVLMEIFGADRPENAQVYRQRVVELDPYAALVTGTVFQTNEVPDPAVNIERLDWNGQPASPQADWSASQAISLEGSTNRDEQPDWLKNAYAETTPPTSPSPTRPVDQTLGGPALTSGTGSPSPASAGEEEIPAFLRAAGWGQSTGAFDESKPMFGEEPSSATSQPIEQGDIPDWVKAMAPTEATPAPAEEEQMPDWINKIGTGALSVPTPTESNELDWMSQLGQTSEPASTSQTQENDFDWMNQLGQTPEPAPDPQTTGSELDWMNQADSSSQAMPVQQQSDDQTDWMRQFDPSSSPAPVTDDMPDWMAQPNQAAQSLPLEQSSDDQPDWMKRFDQQTVSVPSEDQPDWMKQVEEPVAPAPISDEQPDWMRPLDLTTDLTQPDSSISDDQTDWIKQFDQPGATPTPTDFDFLNQPADETQSEMQADSSTSKMEVNNLGVSEQERDDSFAWLENLAAKQGASEGLLTRPEDRLEEEPDWVKQAKGLSVDRPPRIVESTPARQEEPEIPSTPVPASIPIEPASRQELEPVQPSISQPQQSANEEELGKSDQERDDSFAWLEGLAAKQGASEGLLTKPEERLEQEPDWVKQAKGLGIAAQTEKPPAESPAMQEAPPSHESPPIREPAANVEELGKSDQERDDSFAWLEGLAAKQGASEGLLTKPEERLEQEPDWVKQAKDLSAPLPAVEPVREETVQSSAPSMDDTAAWLRGLDQEETAVPPAPSRASDETGIWLKGLSAQESPSISTPGSDDAAMWLKSLDEEESKPVPSSEPGDDETAMWLKSLDEAEQVPPAEPATPERSDLPAWMQNIDEEISPSEITPAATTTDSFEEIERPSAQFEAPPSSFAIPKPETGALPSWLRGLEKSEPQESASAPQEELPAWLRDETGEILAEPTEIKPTQITDWQPADAAEVEPPIPELAPAMDRQPVEEKQPEPPRPISRQPEPMEIAQEAPIRVEKPESKPEPEPAPIPAPPQPYKEPVTRRGTGMLTMPLDPILGSARNELSRSNIPGALDAYAKLIKKGRFLDEVVHDLREALYRYPVEVNIWQSLGDAYMRSNRLQDALDAYTKAEELLR